MCRLSKTKPVIGMVAHAPASANVLYPIYLKLLSLGIDVVVYSYHSYVTNLFQLDSTYLLENGYSPIDKELDILLYGTGSSNEIEVNLPIFCRENNILSISILDMPTITKESVIQRYHTLPNKIYVPNELTKQSIESVYPQIAVFVTGNPHTERLIEYVETRKLQDDLTIVFISQCSTAENYSDTDNSLKELLETSIAYFTVKDIRVKEFIIVPHPRENTFYFEEYISQHKDEIPFSIRISCRNKDGNYYLANTSNTLMVGVHSTIIYESGLIGKPYITDTCFELNIVCDKLTEYKHNGTIPSYNINSLSSTELISTKLVEKLNRTK